MKKLVVHTIENCAECPLAYLEYFDHGNLHCSGVDSLAPCPEKGFLRECVWADRVEPDDESFEAMGENPAL